MIKKFEDILDIVNGKNQKKVEDPNGAYPIYGSGGVMGYANDYLCKADTVIIGRKGNINNPIYVEEPFWNVDTAFGLVARQDMLLPKYLYYFCIHYDFKKLNTTVTIPSLTKANLLNVEMDVPDIEEQKSIVEKLDLVIKLILLQKENIKAYDRLIKSRFVEIFGDINSKKWNIQPLGELCTITRGGSPRPIENYLGGDVPWIKIGDATDGESVYLHSTKECIIKDGIKKSRLVKSGSLIFANCGVSLGFARIITFDGCIHDGWLAMENIDKKINKVFLLHTLNQMTEHFRKIAPAGTQPNLNTAIMKAYKQIIPPMEMQNEFVNFVEHVDKLKLMAQQRLDKLEILKSALMQQFFG